MAKQDDQTHEASYLWGQPVKHSLCPDRLCLPLSEWCGHVLPACTHS